MIDVLFISPLGWSKHVWDKLLTDQRFAHKSCEIIEFLNISFEDISIASIDRSIGDSLENLAPDGLVITASYGTAVLNSFLKRNAVRLNRLLVIDGLDRMPSSQELEEIVTGIEDRVYENVEDYYEEMLSADERDDVELLQILAANLMVRDGAYFPTLDLKNTVAYLSLYSNLDIAKEFDCVLNQIQHVLVFSSRFISFPHISIREEDHLLMLRKPQQVLAKIFEEVENPPE